MLRMKNMHTFWLILNAKLTQIQEETKMDLVHYYVKFIQFYKIFICTPKLKYVFVLQDNNKYKQKTIDI